MKTIFFCLWLPLAYCAKDDWGDFTSVITNAKQNAGEYSTFVSLLTNASYLSYTSTIGSTYWKPQDQNASIGNGWTRESFKSDPAGGGASIFGQKDSAMPITLNIMAIYYVFPQNLST